MDRGAGTHTRPTTDYWQHLLDGWPGGGSQPQPPYRYDYPVRLPDGRVLVLPLRTLPERGRAVASLIANQASLAVVDALGRHMGKLARATGADLVVGVPTLGLTFAPLVAARLGHARYVPLGYSRKFWYDDALSEPVFSITSPGGEKRIYLDPNALPLLAGRRICLVDDAISTGSSALAGYRLLARLGMQLTAVVVAMKQTTRWQQALDEASPELRDSVRAVFGCPLFAQSDDGWSPIEGTLPQVP
jgi:adenine/guanine phosphoribosyltransferase-like PRPP-binding protein